MNYTSIEQSKKLLELGLNPETADMRWFFWNSEIDAPKVPTLGFDKTALESYKNTQAIYLPCWSLGALMELMPKICEDENDGGCYPTVCKGFNTDMWHCVYRSTLYVTNWYKSSIDAAFEMVVWLLENGYIKKGE